MSGTMFVAPPWLPETAEARQKHSAEFTDRMSQFTHPMPPNGPIPVSREAPILLPSSGRGSSLTQRQPAVRPIHAISRDPAASPRSGTLSPRERKDLPVTRDLREELCPDEP
jgi:hypothetical protein